MAPAAIVMPTTMNEAFMRGCHGEHTRTDEELGYGPHAVFPRSLMNRVFKLNGVVQVEATTTCATKNCAARSHASAPTRTFNAARIIVPAGQRRYVVPWSVCL